MRVLVTGSRTWTDWQLLEAALSNLRIELGGFTLVHGDARGVDRRAAAFVRDELALPVEHHPADWERYGKRAGFVRNAEMVASGIDLCVAFIQDGSRGASMCAALAEKAGIQTRRWER